VSPPELVAVRKFRERILEIYLSLYVDEFNLFPKIDYKLHDLEIRVGNNTNAQRNPLCAWFPGSVGTSPSNPLIMIAINCLAFLFSRLFSNDTIHFNSPWTGDAETKLFQCAKVLIGQFVFVQMVGVESSLSLCEVEVFSAGAGNL
jgi:hypothetical protein